MRACLDIPVCRSEHGWQSAVRFFHARQTANLHRNFRRELPHARPARDPRLREWQLDTSAWWAMQGRLFDPVISEIVIREARLGGPAPAARRLAALEGIEILPDTPEIRVLGHRLLAASGLPKKQRRTPCIWPFVRSIAFLTRCFNRGRCLRNRMR